MIDNARPNTSKAYDTKPIERFIADLQQATDTGNTDLFNKSFAADILWGSPFAAIASGYEQIHTIHKKMFSSVTAVKGAAKFETEYIRFISADVAVAYVRRLSKKDEPKIEETKPGSFDELALFVLVKENEKWWLAAAQHEPDRRDVYLTKS